MTTEEFSALKQEYLSRITENNTCTDPEKKRKNIRLLREEIDERAERRMAGLKDLDSYADEATQQRVLAAVQLEKQALDEAISEVLVDGKLPLEREAFTEFGKRTGLSRRNTRRVQNATTGLFKTVVLHFSFLCLCIFLAPTVFSFFLSLFGVGALLIKGLFEDTAYFSGIVSYTLRGLYNSFSLLLWPIDAKLKAEYLTTAIILGVLGYFVFSRHFLQKES